MDRQLFIVTGPSGAGKNTIMTHLFKTFPAIKKAVTFTTRPPRPHEANGVDYWFVDQEEFFSLVRDGSILEYEQVYKDYFYGSPSKVFEQGPIIMMEMDWQGHRTYRRVYPDIPIASFFLVPPSLEAIRKRILARSRVDNLSSRLANALEQLEHASEYSYVIVNDEKCLALSQIETLVRAEFIKGQRRSGLARAQQILQKYQKAETGLGMDGLARE